MNFAEPATMSNLAETWRTFIALPLPADWQCALASVIRQLATAAPQGMRWTAPANIHLTLRFLGDTDPDVVPEIIARLRQSASEIIAPTLSLCGLGTFPARGEPRIIWAGLAGELERLAELRRIAESVVVALGWPAERRPFRPHLTVGRCRDRASAGERRAVQRAIAVAAIPPASLWRPDAVRLYRSVLTPHGPIYTILGEVKI